MDGFLATSSLGFCNFGRFAFPSRWFELGQAVRPCGDICGKDGLHQSRVGGPFQHHSIQVVSQKIQPTTIPDFNTYLNNLCSLPWGLHTIRVSKLSATTPSGSQDGPNCREPCTEHPHNVSKREYLRSGFWDPGM